MLKLTKYLKPFWLSIVLIIGILFIQAQSELALPDYMSRIVDNGIQSSGVEDAAIEAVRVSQMEDLLVFVLEEDQEEVLSNYTLIEQGDSNYQELYPTVATEPIYVLNDIDNATREELSNTLSKPFVILSALSQEQVLTQFNATSADDIVAIAKINETVRDEIISMIDTQFTSSDLIVSASLMSVGEEYAALGVDQDAMQLDYIVSVGMTMLLIALLGAVCSIVVGFLSSKVSAGLAKNLREAVFSKVEKFSSMEFNKFSTASLITRTTNDVQQVQMVMSMMLRIVIYAPILGFGALINVFNTNVDMLWIIAVVIVTLVSVIILLFSIATPKFKIIQKMVDKINLIMREFLTGMLVMRAFNTEQYEEDRFDEANKQITKINLFVNRVVTALQPIMMFIMNAVSVLIVWVGASYIDLGTLQIGDMMAFIQYTTQILMAFIMISVIAIMIPQAAVSAGRILEVINCDLSILDPENPVEFNKVTGEIIFNEVCFKYPGSDAYVLENISFVAKPGQTTAFIGSTGSGKSTLINLIPRFFDVTSGTIKIDDIDIQSVSQHDLREHIGYVPQKGMLFSGDIESNLRYAKEDATNEEIQKAIEVSQSKEFIENKEDGINSAIAQGGTNVSGGQKQRLSIARALTKNPQVYIFDDTFSALDFKTDALLREALNKLMKETKNTVLLVAQRISTIKDADQIIVLDKGKIVGKGKHRDLLNTCEVYQEIAYSQLSKEELENE